MKKQFKEATATVLFFGWKASAVVFLTWSSFAIVVVLDPVKDLTIVFFL